MGYTSVHVAKIFDITPQTVSVWAKEFSAYLSPTANPGQRRKRVFTSEDMTVFALISEMQNDGGTFTDIHASLHSGSRGNAPLIEPEEINQIVSGDAERILALEVEKMQHALIEAQQALRKAEQDLQRLRHVEDENIRLTTKLEQAETQLQSTKTELQQQVKDLMEKVEDLSREIGREYTKGFMEGLKSQSQSSNGTD